MTRCFSIRFWKLALLVALLGIVLAACGDRNKATHATFVGKWKSSKLETPLFLYANGEWEIKNDDGGVLQYGIWDYRDGRIIWTIKLRSEIMHEVNPVVSATDKEFRLKEGTQVTVFERLD
jgi:hypothetical protein